MTFRWERVKHMMVKVELGEVTLGPVQVKEEPVQEKVEPVEEKVEPVQELVQELVQEEQPVQE